jgi:uncharacterized membrane protein YdjX (TVP38/TMEM64 family)
MHQGVQLAVVIVVVLVAAWLISLGVLDLHQLRALLDRRSGWLFFLLLYTATCIFLFPAGILTVLAGAIFGVTKAIVLVWAGATLGGCAAFLVSRYLLRDWVEREVMTPDMRRIERAANERGWLIVFLARLTPFVPFRLTSYVFGITAIPFAKYASATSLGILPTAILYVYIGAGLASGSVARSLVLVACLLILLVVLLFVGRHEWQRVLTEGTEVSS